MESAAVSDMSAGQDALDQLDERVRLLGSTLAGLGWDVAFQQLASKLPDARERLLHVGQMTEDFEGFNKLHTLCAIALKVEAEH